MSECVYTRAECHHQGTKCSECPLTDLICDEFTDCLDLSYQQGKADREKELSELPNEYSEKLWKIAHDKGYDKGKSDGAREFAEWLTASYVTTDVMNKRVWADELLAEWQKGEK